MSIYNHKFSQEIFTSPNTSLSKIINLIPPKSKKILDIGCSSGYLGQYIKQKFNYSVDGIDINKDDLKIATKNLDKTYHLDIQLDNLSTIKSKYDVLIFADILEHTTNPQSIIQKFKSKLTKDGIIIISVPNIIHQSIILNLLNRHWQYTDTGILDKTHLRFFDKTSIIKLIKDSGFKIQKIDFTIHPYPKINNILLKFLLHHQEFKIFQYIIKATSE